MEHRVEGVPALHVLAIVSIKPGKLEKALEAYRLLVPAVKAREPGCLEYAPTRDEDLGLENQDCDPDRIIVTERWRSADDFRAHLCAPHVLDFRKTFSAWMERIELRITRELF